MGSDVYVVSKNGVQLEGRFTIAQIRELMNSEPNVPLLVWQEGMPTWVSPQDLPGIADSQGAAPPPHGAPDSNAQGTWNLGSIKQDKLKQVRQQLQLGFVPTLFDLSFSSMITPKLIKFFYVVAIVVIAIMSVGGLGGAINTIFLGIRASSSGIILGGIVGILLVPIGFLLGVAFARLYAELVIVVFKIKENLDIIAEKD